MFLKKICFLFLIGGQIHCEQQKQKLVYSDPDINVYVSEGSVALYAYNNNSHIIEYSNGKATVTRDESGPPDTYYEHIKSVESSKKNKAKENNTRTFELSSPSIKEKTFCVVNNNDHVIVQNNSQVNTTQVQPAPASPTIEQPAISKSYVAPTGFVSFMSGIFSSNKYKIILASAGICWAAIYAKLLYCAHAINSSSGWSNWANHLTTEALQQADAVILSQDLLKDIQQKYAKRKINFLSPLVNFINDVDAEIVQINSFLRLHEMLSTIKLAILFPAQKETLHVAIDKIQRLEFFKSLVMQLTPEYKKKK